VGGSSHGIRLVVVIVVVAAAAAVDVVDAAVDVDSDGFWLVLHDSSSSSSSSSRRRLLCVNKNNNLLLLLICLVLMWHAAMRGRRCQRRIHYHYDAPLLCLGCVDKTLPLSVFVKKTLFFPALLGRNKKKKVFSCAVQERAAGGVAYIGWQTLKTQVIIICSDTRVVLRSTRLFSFSSNTCQMSQLRVLLILLPAACALACLGKRFAEKTSRMNEREKGCLSTTRTY
jgi:hypothetical protein